MDLFLKKIFFFIFLLKKDKKSNGLVSKVYKQNKLNLEKINKIKKIITLTLKNFNYRFGPFHAEL